MITPKEVHFVVFVHGLWGNTGHLKYFVEEFKKRHDYTYDGIDVCGDRLIKKEEKIIQENNNFKITKFSIIGYSLGGLIARYAIGIRREDDGIWTKVFNWSSSILLSKTGRVYANTTNDRTVPYWTASISIINPYSDFKQLKIIENENFQSLIGSLSKKPQKNSAIKKLIGFIKRFFLFTVVVPILFPFWFVIVFSTVTIQGIKSRRREEAIETAMNIKNLLPQSQPPSPTLLVSDIESNNSNSTNSDDNNEFNSMINSSTPLQSTQVTLSKAQSDSCRYLNKLEWEKYSVYLDVMNAHAAIIVRNKLQGAAGKEVLKHFIEVFDT
ncbi:1458_t:CDS:2 [Entrophospora sp. SA101]|nr:1458_t:CDS:2 [Entrophospora sp. SA101]